MCLAEIDGKSTLSTKALLTRQAAFEDRMHPQTRERGYQQAIPVAS